VIPGLQRGVSLAAARRHIAEAFRKKDIESPDLDARVLIGHALGLDQAGMMSAADRALTEDEIAAIAALAARRLVHEPVARILGSKEFWSLEFQLSPATLVPRPETETVVEAALKAIEGQRNRSLRIADLGTGSGALLLALLSELPNATGIGTDVSLPALRTARENAARLGLSGRAHFVACDFGAALNGEFDLVVSNPPYVARDDIALLLPEVREHDPIQALDGGVDGLDCYRRIATHARRILAPGGTLVVELGAGQAPAVTALLRDGGIAAAGTVDDLAGHPRALSGCLSHAETASPGPKIALGICSKSD
jgi:release factor glutamine methyltransferase